MKQLNMNQQDATGSSEPDWRALEEEVLAHAKRVSQKIVERVKRVTRDTLPHNSLPTDPTDETPPLPEGDPAPDGS